MNESAATSLRIAVTVGITVRYPGGAKGEHLLSGSPADVARGLAAHAAAGVDHATVALEPLTEEILDEFLAAVTAFRAAAPP